MHPTLRFGTSADAVPEASEATIVGANGMGTIDAYVGDMHHLIFRLESEGDIASVLYSDDQSQTNQVGAFTKYAQTVDVVRRYVLCLGQQPAALAERGRHSHGGLTMPITLRDYLTFPFNAGKGIRATQIADVDVPALSTTVDDLKTGRLGYTWRYAIKRGQDFDSDAFVHLLEGASSGFPELVTPAFNDTDTYFGAVAIPLAEPEAAVLTDSGFAQDILNNYTYRRLEEPVYILDVPHRVWAGRFYLNPLLRTASAHSSSPRRLACPGTRVTPSRRRPTVVPAFGDIWSKSYSPVVPVGAYPGSRFVHLLLPHGTAPAPTPRRVGRGWAGEHRELVRR